MRKTDRPFQLATLGILCINFALFNVGLPTDLVGHLSDDSYYGLLLLLIGLIGGLAVRLLVKSRRWDLYGKFTFKASNFAVFVLVFLAHFLWDMFSAEVFPPTKNSIALAEVSSGLSGWALVLIRYVYACLLAPIVEELVFRDLVMTALASYQKYKLDMLVSASLFSLSHVWQHGWDLPSFIVYLVPGLLFCAVLRYTKSIYWAILQHASWNSFLTLLSLLVSGIKARGDSGRGFYSSSKKQFNSAFLYGIKTTIFSELLEYYTVKRLHFSTKCYNLI